MLFALEQFDTLHKTSKKKAKAERAKAREAAVAVRPGLRHPLLAGFVLGAGMVGLVAVLVFLALNDAQPRPEDPTVVAQSAGGAPAFDRGEPTLPPAIAAQVESLKGVVSGNPEDLQSRRQLAELLLAYGQYFEAFEQAQAVLGKEPSDPTGNVVAGFVRLAMSQTDAALQHFDAAIEADPANVSAALMRGLILMEGGDRTAAIEGWRSALEAMGGDHAALEEVVRLAEEGGSLEEIQAIFGGS